MTPAELTMALTVRRRREERALAALQRAQALQAEAQGRLAEAVGALAAFDARMDASLQAFEERARTGINPHSITSMRGFHSDQLKIRESFHDPIAMARGAVALAEGAVADARRRWRQASQAAGNLHDMRKTMIRTAERDLERRQEQDRDEIAATRAARTGSSAQGS